MLTLGLGLAPYVAKYAVALVFIYVTSRVSYNSSTE